MKYASYFPEKVDMMPCFKTAGFLLAGLVLVATESGAEDQTTSPAELPVCSGIASPAFAVRTRTLPALEEEHEGEVGEVLLDATPIVIRAGSLELNAPATFSGRFLFTDFTVTIPAGPVETDEAGNHRPPNYEVQYSSERRPRTGSGRPAVRLEVSEGGTQLLGILEVAGGRRYPIAGADFKISECYLTTSATVRRQLIYVGVSRGVISLEYRELSGNIVRPAFTQDLSYDLADGDVIGVKGARIRVISANNTGIRYIVMRPFTE